MNLMYKTGSSPVFFAFRYQSVAGYFLSTGYSKLLSLLISVSGAEKLTSHPVKQFFTALVSCEYLRFHSLFNSYKWKKYGIQTSFWHVSVRIANICWRDFSP